MINMTIVYHRETVLAELDITPPVALTASASNFDLTCLGMLFSFGTYSDSDSPSLVFH